MNKKIKQIMKIKKFENHITEKIIYERIALSDLVLSQEDSDNIAGKYVTVVDGDGKEIGEVEIYTAGYQLEDGTECDEDGDEL